jgi:hypothetical protein
MSDSSGGLGGSGADTTQGDQAKANASQQQGDGRLLGPRSGRDVSRPMARTLKTGSSTHDQATKAQP